MPTIVIAAGGHGGTRRAGARGRRRAARSAAPRSSSSAASGPRPSSCRPPAIRSTRCGGGLDRRNPLRAARALCMAARATGRGAPPAARHRRGRRAGRRRLRRRARWGWRRARCGMPLALTEADSHLGLTNRLLAPLRARGSSWRSRSRGASGRATSSPGARCRRAPTGPTATAARAASASRRTCPACSSSAARSAPARERGGARGVRVGGARAPCCTPAGQRDYDELRRRLDELGSPPHYRLFGYIEPFADALAAADLAVARAGGSVFELAAAGLPAILVPYPHATADHQTAQRALDGARPARRWWSRTASSTARAWRARWRPARGARRLGGDGRGRAGGRAARRRRPRSPTSCCAG